MRTLVLIVSSLFLLLTSKALAQDVPELPRLAVKYGLSVGMKPGVYAGLNLKLAKAPVRLDADAWSSFEKFGRESAGLSFTANYIKPLRNYYLGIGVGYARAVERGDSFDTVATKYIVGAKIPGTGATLEGAAIWTQHAIGSGHLIGTISMVWKL